MNMNNLLTKGLAVCQWILDFAILNFLFVVGTLIGGVVLGVFPAFFATIEVLRRLLIEEGKIAILKPFIQAYKENFIRSLQIGYLGLFVVGVAFSNMFFWRQMEGVEWSGLLSIGWFVVLVGVTLAALLVSPIAVHDKLTIKETARLFLFSFGQPHLSLMLLAGLVVIYFGFWYITGAFIFLGGSLALAWITFSSHLLVKRIEKLQGSKY